jgi:hypothetical protein
MEEIHALLKKNSSSKVAYTKLLFSGFSTGINVNTGKNQHVSHVYIETSILNKQSFTNWTN